MTPSPDKSVDKLIQEAIDVVALGYPVDGSEAEKAVFMVELRRLLELRAPIVRAEIRKA